MRDTGKYFSSNEATLSQILALAPLLNRPSSLRMMKTLMKTNA